MTAAQLLEDLARLGIRLEAHGDRLRYSPRSAVTPELAELMRAHKDELLVIVRSKTALLNEFPNARAVWKAVLDQLEGDPLFPTDLMEALRTADAHWAGTADLTQ